jgi:hypothetical protein
MSGDRHCRRGDVSAVAERAKAEAIHLFCSVNLARRPAGAGVSLAIVAFPIVSETLYGGLRFHLALTRLSINIKGLAVTRGLWRAA